MMTIAQTVADNRLAIIKYQPILKVNVTFGKRVVIKQLDDPDLMIQIAQGSETALSELYDRYSNLVMSVAFAVVRNRETAEEVTLSTFIQVWQKAHTYNSQLAKVTTWLTRVARNRAIDGLRWEEVRPLKHSIPWAEVTTEPVNASDNPETAVHHTLQRQRVRNAVAALPEHQREALVLAFFKGYSHKEIARTLNQPLGTVKSRIRAGMQKLREFLEED